MERRALNRQEIRFLVGVPLAWAVLLLFHPAGEGEEIYQELQDVVPRFLVVHIGMMIFIPLWTMAVLLLLRGVEGTAAWISRIAVVVFAVFYSAYEVLQGIATGVLADQVTGLPESERAIGAELIQDFAEHPLVRDLGVFAGIGGVGLITAVIAAAIALRRHASAPLSVAVLLVISGFLIQAHPPPFGPTGLAVFIVAVLLFVRSQSAARALSSTA